MSLKISWNTQTTGTSDDGDTSLQSFEHTLEFDCVTSESAEVSAMLTEHAVESGAPISDHKRAQPKRVTIEAIVTQTPLGAPPSSGYGGTEVNANVKSGDEGSVGNVVVFSAGFDRIGDVLSTLDRLVLEDTTVTLSTKYAVYENVQVIHVTRPREASDGDSLRFQIEVQQVRIAESRTIDTPTPREPRGSAPVDRGGQAAEDSATRRQSALASMRHEYNRRIEAGESRYDAATGAAGAAFGF